MNQEFTRKLEVFAESKKAIEKDFALEYGMSQAVAALLYAIAGQEADTVRMKESRKILQMKRSFFSAFRDSSELIVLARMAMTVDPERYLDDLIEVFNVFSQGSFFESGYMVLTAMIICDSDRKSDAQQIKVKTDEIMRRMSQKHPLLTDSEDLALAALLAMTERDVNDIIDDMEECYEYTKKTLRLGADSNSIQALSQIIALTDDNVKEQCDKVAELFGAFKDQKAKFGTYLEFPALATLIDVDMPADELVGEIIEAAAYLKDSKALSGLEMDNKTRLMFAAMLASDVYKTGGEVGDGVGSTGAAIAASSALAMIIAEEVALLCVMMCACSTVNT